MVTKDEVKAEVAKAIAGYHPANRMDAARLEDFKKAVVEPRLVTVNFSGGITQKCWNVTRSNGMYRVIFLPTAGYFSLCVESDFGPLDIGVHGDAIGCFGSV
ncbi:hypothetical protein E7681_01135 [Thalassobius vesicularis]|uniref:Uncharacterized protein n=1 Tax=Thalassobius vesicularis TaxID=1294297 RepID=A0A4S3MDY7_9RHOB|nr:hypothetical protein [Thalassobius vesicularis]THD76476.1 hypothetical protein E7681_01135 [Thalassobius vesicularis]